MADTGGSVVAPPSARTTHQAVTPRAPATSRASTASWPTPSRTRPCSVAGSRSWSQPPRATEVATGRCACRPAPGGASGEHRCRSGGLGRRPASSRRLAGPVLGPGHGGCPGSGRRPASSALSSASRRRATSATCSSADLRERMGEPRNGSPRRVGTSRGPCGQPAVAVAWGRFRPRTTPLSAARRPPRPCPARRARRSRRRPRRPRPARSPRLAASRRPRCSASASALSGLARCATATSTWRSSADATASSSRRDSARAAVRTFSRVPIRPSTISSSGFTASAEPSSAAAAPMRPPRRRYSRVST